MRFYFLFSPILFSQLIVAQGVQEPFIPGNAPLIANPAVDQFEFCKQLCKQANSMKSIVQRRNAYLRIIPRLESYLKRFPNVEQTPAAKYYLGECYYHTGSLDKGRGILDAVVKKYGESIYGVRAANRLAADAVSRKEYAKAAGYFGKVAKAAPTPEESYRARYQQASCFLYADYKESAIKTFTVIAKAEDIQASYRNGAKLQLGNLYYEKKNLKLAMEYFEQLMLPGVGPATKNEATFHVGLISLEQGDSRTAQSCFKSVLLSDQDKFKPNAQTALVRSLYQEEKYKEVLAVMRGANHKGNTGMEAEKFTLAGQSAFKLERYEDAIKYFAMSERQEPLSKGAFDAGYYRLLCFYRIKGTNIPDQVDAFLEIYQRKYGKHERVHKALLAKAETLFEQGEFRNASSVYNKIDEKLVGEKNHANLLYKRGCSLASSGDHNNAVRSFTDFINKYGDDLRMPSSIARRGLSYLSVGDRSSALSDFDLLIERYPKDKLASLAYQSSAKIKKEDKDYPEMIRRYTALVTEFPTLRPKTVANAEYWIGWGNYELKKYEEAISHLDKAVKVEPAKYGFKAELLIAYCAYARKDERRLQVAIDRIQDLDKAEKIPIPIYRWAGQECYKVGEYKKAEHYLSLGVTPLEPRQTSSNYWKLLGSSRVKIGKYEEAFAPIKNFLDVEEEPFWRAEAYYDQAVAYLGVDKRAEAKESAESSLELRPAGKLNAEVRIILGDIAYKNKEYAEAAKFYVVVVQLFVDDEKLRPEALYKSHLALSKKGDTKEAADYLEILNKEFPDYLKKK